MLKLKLKYFGHLMQRADSLEKALMLGNNEGRRRRGNGRWDDWMASPTQRIWVWASSGNWWWTGKPGMCCSPWGLKESDTTERLNNNKAKMSTEAVSMWYNELFFASVTLLIRSLIPYMPIIIRGKKQDSPKSHPPTQGKWTVWTARRVRMLPGVDPGSLFT